MYNKQCLKIEVQSIITYDHNISTAITTPPVDCAASEQ